MNIEDQIIDAQKSIEDVYKWGEEDSDWAYAADHICKCAKIPMGWRWKYEDDLDIEFFAL